jgi:hypothetical protein
MTQLGSFVLEHVQSRRSRRQEDRVEPWRPISLLVRRLCSRCGLQLDKRGVEAGGETAHWLIGMANGVIYATLRERSSLLRRWHGLPIAALMFAMDEVVAPLIGIAPPPQRFPLETHLRSAFNHAVFGWTLAAICDAVAIPPQ